MKSAPVPLFNYKKRQRQALVSDPQTHDSGISRADQSKGTCPAQPFQHACPDSDARAHVATALPPNRAFQGNSNMNTLGSKRTAGNITNRNNVCGDYLSPGGGKDSFKMGQGSGTDGLKRSMANQSNNRVNIGTSRNYNQSFGNNFKEFYFDDMSEVAEEKLNANLGRGACGAKPAQFESKKRNTFSREMSSNSNLSSSNFSLTGSKPAGQNRGQGTNFGNSSRGWGNKPPKNSLHGGYCDNATAGERGPAAGERNRPYNSLKVTNSTGCRSVRTISQPETPGRGSVANFQTDTKARNVHKTVTGNNNELEQRQSMKSVQQRKTRPDKGKPDMSMRIFTCSIADLKSWCSSDIATGLIMFEIYGVVDSATMRDKSGTAKEFVLRDDTSTIKCIFYEIDRELPRLTRGHIHRAVGTVDAKRGLMKVVSVRAADREERQVCQISSTWSQTEMGALVNEQ